MRTRVYIGREIGWKDEWRRDSHQEVLSISRRQVVVFILLPLLLRHGRFRRAARDEVWVYFSRPLLALFSPFQLLLGKPAVAAIIDDELFLSSSSE